MDEKITKNYRTLEMYISLCEGKPINKNDTFTVCLSSYRLTGYDFPLLTNKKALFETTLIYPALLEQFCRNLNEDDLKNYGHFKVIL